MHNTLYYVQQIEKHFGYASGSAKCIASFIYEKYFCDVKLIDNNKLQHVACDRELDCLYTIYLILMLCHNLDNKDVCLNLESIFTPGGVLDTYKAYEKESIRLYALSYPQDKKHFRAVHFDKKLFEGYIQRISHSLLECIEYKDSNLIDSASFASAADNIKDMAAAQAITDTQDSALKAVDRDCEDNNSSTDKECPLILSLNRLYIRRNYLYESYIAQYIATKEKNRYIDEAKIQGILPKLFNIREGELNYQLLCALLSIYQGFSIISGGPGTGKTTTVLKLLFLHLYLNQGQNLDIRLCAPTGKAAGRMKESIVLGLNYLKYSFKDDSALLTLIDKIPTEACTIHSLIGVMPRSSKSKYNENNKLTIDVLIVDEVSMVDMALFVKLLKAIEDKTMVIMLGDKDQLCSVEAGSVLGDICQTFFNHNLLKDETLSFISRLSGYSKDEIQKQEAISEHVGLLKKSHRFKEGSSIFNLALQVNAPLHENFTAEDKLGALKNILNTINNNQNDNIALYEMDDENKSFDIKDVIFNITNKALVAADESKIKDGDDRASYEPYLSLLCKHDFSVDIYNRGGLTIEDVFKQMNRFRILCSNREGDLGCSRLCYEIESAIKRKYGFGDTEFFPGRIILVTRNNKILDLNNGDVGFVAYDRANRGTDREKNLYVWFLSKDSSREGAVRIPIAFLDSYESAFCMTIHKSQGSEYDHVLIALSSRYNEVLTKELIYTAITRAREYVSLFYSKSIFFKACLEEVKRQSGLKDRLLYSLK